MNYELSISISPDAIGFAGIKGEAIPFLGVHAFDEANDGVMRRQKRVERRRLRRKAARKRAIARLLAQFGFALPSSPLPIATNVWQLRAEGVTRKLSASEFGRVLLHIAANRGVDYAYHSAKPSSAKSAETRTREADRQLREALANSGCVTIGQYLASLPKQRNDHRRFDRLIDRDLLRQEVHSLFERQREFGNSLASEELERAYAGAHGTSEPQKGISDGLAFRQRPLRSVEGRMGYCVLEPAERRAPKRSYSAELFVAWSHLNRCRIVTSSGQVHPLSDEQKRQLIARVHEESPITFEAAQSALALDDNHTLLLQVVTAASGRYGWVRAATAQDSAIFIEMPGYHALRAIVPDWRDWFRLAGAQRDVIDEAGRILAVYPDRDRRRTRLSTLLPEAALDRLASVSGFSGTINLSLKAVRTLLPLIERGLSYSDARSSCGYDRVRTTEGVLQLPPLRASSDPRVTRVCAQVRKVVNAILERHGLPSAIILSVADDLEPLPRRRRSQGHAAGLEGELVLLRALDDPNVRVRELGKPDHVALTLKRHFEQHLRLPKGMVTAKPNALALLIARLLRLDRDGYFDRKYALDAALLGTASPKYVAKLCAEHTSQADGAVESTPRLAPPPWTGFVEAVRAALSTVHVSRQVRRTLSGPAHEDTVRSVRSSDGAVIQRVRIEKLTYKLLDNLVDLHRNRALHALLKERLDAFDGDAGKAFAEPVYMPTNVVGSRGPRVTSVRIVTAHRAGLAINGGVARNGRMVRVDVFHADGQYRFVPMYAHHFAKGAVVPMRAVRRGAPEAEWEAMDPSQFLFPLYCNDLIRIVTDDADRLAYFRTADRSTGRIAVIAHDRDSAFGTSGEERSFALNSIRHLEKLRVDYFGQVHPCPTVPRFPGDT